MADTTLKEVTQALAAAAKELKGVEGVTELQGLTRALSDYAEIDWSKFGKGANKGLDTFAGLGGAFKKVATSLKAFENVRKNSTEVFKDLSKGLSLFSEIDWDGVKDGLISIKYLKDTFTKAEDGFIALAAAVKVLKDSSADFEAFTLLSESLKTFSDIDWDGVEDGLISIKYLKDTFTKAEDGFIALAAAVKVLNDSSDNFAAFTQLSESLKTFSDIDWDGVEDGLISIEDLKDTFTKAEDGFIAFADSVALLYDSSDNFAAFTQLSESLKTFSDIDWDGVEDGLISIKYLKDTFKDAKAGFKAFAAAVKVLKDSSADFEAFTLLSSSLKTFSEIDWGKVIWGFTMMATLPKLINVAAAGFKAFAVAVKGLKNSSKDFEAFTLLSSSLKTFSEIAWGKVILGFMMMAILPKLINVAAAGFKAFAVAVKGLKNSSKDFEGFKALSEALKTFGDIKWGKVLFGLVALKMISPLFKVFGKAVNELGKSIGSKEAKQTIQSFVQFTNALKTFGEIRWGMVFIGTVILRLFAGALKVFASAQGAMNVSMKMLKVFVKGLSAALTQLGAAAMNPLFWTGMAALGAFALILIGFGIACTLAGVGVLLIAIAFERFMKAAFEGIGMMLGLADRAADLAKVGIAFMILGYGLGFFAVAGLAAIPAMIALTLFVSVLSLLSGGFAIFGKAVDLVARGFERFVKAAFDGIDKMIELGKSAPGLLKTALAIALVSAALIAFSAAGVAAAAGGLVSGVLEKITPGMSNLEKILALASASDGLDKTATALERINAALNAMPSKDGIDLSVAGSEGAQNASDARTAASGGGQNAAGGNSKKTINNKVSTVVFNNSWMPDRSSALILAHAF